MNGLIKAIIFLSVSYMLVINSPLVKNSDFIGDQLKENNEVLMYSLKTCGICKNMKAKLKKAGIPFQEILLDDMSEYEQGALITKVSMESSVTDGGVPFFKVNGVWLAHRGIQISEIEDQLFFKR